MLWRSPEGARGASLADRRPARGLVRYVLARVQNLYRPWGRNDEAQRWLERYEAAGGRPSPR
jgi:hypothetical protein